jgi:hypothetical protein
MYNEHCILCAVQQQENDDLVRMQGHMIAMEAPLYQSYRVYIINRVRAKTEIHLGKQLCRLPSLCDRDHLLHSKSAVVTYTCTD